MESIDFRNVFGKPFNYKGIDIYPVKIIEAPSFYSAARCLLVEKNKIQDASVIKMSYLKFLFALGQQEVEFFTLLENLLDIVLKKKFRFDVNDNGRITLNVDGKVLHEKDFDKIRKIILTQNNINHEEDTILDPEFAKEMQEASEYLSRQSGEMANLEERIIIYHCVTGLDYDKIANLTIYQFNKALERINLIQDYKILKTAQYSGFVEIKADIPHMMSHIKEKGKYEDLLMSKQQFDKLAGEINAPV